jgi:hypothetical protein
MIVKNTNIPSLELDDCDAVIDEYIKNKRLHCTI